MEHAALLCSRANLQSETWGGCYVRCSESPLPTKGQLLAGVRGGDGFIHVGVPGEGEEKGDF